MSARAVIDAAVWAAIGVLDRLAVVVGDGVVPRAPAIEAGCASLIRSKVTISGRATPSGSGADSSSTRLL